MFEFLGFVLTVWFCWAVLSKLVEPRRILDAAKNVMDDAADKVVSVLKRGKK